MSKRIVSSKDETAALLRELATKAAPYISTADHNGLVCRAFRVADRLQGRPSAKTYRQPRHRHAIAASMLILASMAGSASADEGHSRHRSHGVPMSYKMGVCAGLRAAGNLNHQSIAILVTKDGDGEYFGCNAVGPENGKPTELKVEWGF